MELKELGRESRSWDLETNTEQEWHSMTARAEKKKDPAEPILRNMIQKHAMRSLDKMKPFSEK
jgi:hypothetical protein